MNKMKEPTQKELAEFAAKRDREQRETFERWLANDERGVATHYAPVRQ